MKFIEHLRAPLTEIARIYKLDAQAVLDSVELLEAQLTRTTREHLDRLPVLPAAPCLAHGAALMGMVYEAYHWLKQRDPVAAASFQRTLATCLEMGDAAHAEVRH